MIITKQAWTVYIAIILAPTAIYDLKNGYAQNGYTQENETNQTEVKSNKYVEYLQNTRNLLNQSLAEYKNANFTGAEELAITAYLDNFEYVEHQIKKNGSHSLVEDIEHMMREKLRDMIKEKASQTDVYLHINATDAKLVEAINLVNGTK